MISKMKRPTLDTPRVFLAMESRENRLQLAWLGKRNFSPSILIPFFILIFISTPS
jgi:hypothetical protein